MKLLLDQDVPRRAAALLREAGVDAIHASEVGLSAAADAEIVAWCRAQEAVAVTLDADLHALVALSGQTAPSTIFNISKMNAEVRGGRAPRIKRLSEVIGESYFEYLAGLDDLVLIMDESHRCRADAGIRVLSELRPVLGLELAATTQASAVAEPSGSRT